MVDFGLELFWAHLELIVQIEETRNEMEKKRSKSDRILMKRKHFQSKFTKIHNPGVLDFGF
jgi:hypothetical protein